MVVTEDGTRRPGLGPCAANDPDPRPRLGRTRLRDQTRNCEGARARALVILRPITGRYGSQSETVALTRWDKDHPTDLEELTSWASILILFGGLAMAVIIGAVVLAFLLSQLSGVFVRSW